MMERMEYTIHDNGSDPISFLRKKHRVDHNPADDSDSDDSNQDLFHNDTTQYDTLFDGITYTENVEVEEQAYQGVDSVYHPSRIYWVLCILLFDIHECIISNTFAIMIRL